MAGNNDASASAIATDGDLTLGSRETAMAQARLKPIASTLTDPAGAVPGEAVKLGLALANASVEINHLAAGQARLVETLELFNASLLKLMDARQTDAGEGAGQAKTATPAEKLKPSQALDAAMTDLDQVLKFVGGQRKQLREANLAMATERMVAASGASAVDLSRVEYVAARSGVGSEHKDASGNIDGVARQQDLTQFARDAAIMAVAFKIDVKNAGEMMGGWRESMKLDRTKTHDLADATNVLGTSVSLKAEAADIGAIVQRQGAAATAAGMTPEQAAALSAALLSVGNNKGAAGAGLEKISSVLAKGDGASEGQRNAWAALKLDPALLATGMKQDAPQTLLTVLEALKAQPAQKQAALATQLFDGNQSILSLVPAIDTVKQAFSLVADKSLYATSALGEQGSVLRSAAVRADSTQAHQQAYEASTTRLGSAKDVALAPIVDTSLSAMTALVNGVGWLAEALPKATVAVALAGAVLAPVLSGVFSGLLGAVKGKVFEKAAGTILGDTAPSDSASKKTGKSTNKKPPKNKRRPETRRTPSPPPSGLFGKTAQVANVAKRAVPMVATLGVIAGAGVDLVNGVQTGDKHLIGNAVGSAGGGLAGGFVGSMIGRAVGGFAGAALGSIIPVAGTVAGGAIGSAIGGAIGGVLGTLVGSDVGSQLGEKAADLSDQLPSPTEIGENLNNLQTDNRQINFAPQITINAPEQAGYQELAALVVQQIEAQFTPLSMDSLLGTRRDSALTDTGVV